MSTDGMIGHGTTMTGASTGAIAEIIGVNIDGMEADEIEFTDMDSENGWKEFEAGLKDAGQVSVNLIYEGSNHDAMQDALGGTNEAWTITFPDGSTFVCSGFLKSLGADCPVEDKITQAAVFRLSGEPAFTDGGGS